MRKLFVISVLFFFFPFIHPAAEIPDLQKLIDETPENGVLQLEGKQYSGNITITKPITIIGTKDTVIEGDHTTNVIEIISNDVHLDSLKIQGSGMDRSSEEEYAGIRVRGNGATLEKLTISDSYHGIFLNKTSNTTITGVNVIGHGVQSLGNQGNGIHIARSSENHISDSRLEKTRDGIFVEYSNDNLIENNTMTETRYGLHYMYSDNNVFENNEFVGNTGGAAIMHSDHILLENNKFSFNQGSRSFGLIIQTSRDVHVLDNEFHLNQRGLYLEQSTSNVVEGNDFFQNQIGVEIWASSTAHVFFHNHFRNNRVHVLSVGGETNNEWFKNGIGNYWDVPMLDLNQNGIADKPLEYTSSLSQLIEDNELAYLFLSSPAITIYEKMNDLLSSQKVMAYDKYPLLEASAPQVWVLWVIILALILLIFYRVYRKRAVNR